MRWCFYGFRDARSQGNWEYWGMRKRMEETTANVFSYFPGVAGFSRRTESSRAVPDVPQYRSLLRSTSTRGNRLLVTAHLSSVEDQLPTHVALDLEQDCPGLLEYVNRHISAALRRPIEELATPHELGQGSCSIACEKEGWLDVVLSHARIHPRHIRMVDYGALCCKSRLGNTALPYPSLGQWRRDAESCVRVSGM